TFTGSYEPGLLDKPPREAPLGMLISPIILAVIVVILFFAPNMLLGTILEPSVQSILPNLLGQGEQYGIHIRAWHGPTTELYMTIGIIVVGTLLFLRLSKWSRVYEYLPHKYTLNYLFDQSLTGMERLSAHV